MEIKRKGSQPSNKGSAEYFTGTVRIEPSSKQTVPQELRGTVSRSRRVLGQHGTHPLGQTLILTSGLGRVQPWGGSVEEIHPGDVVWIPPGKNWHGATATKAMTHIAVQEQLDGKTADWMEKVTDEQYRA